MILVNLSQDKNALNRYISNTLLENIQETLKKNKKVILYLNKRGSHSSLICESCQHLYECDQCDTSLHVHKNPSRLICHTCNNNYQFPKHCSQCGQTTLKEVGVGTQQIEDFCNNYFQKKYKVFRFDTDVVKNKKEKGAALENLVNADIIIGTKMITTGFDFQSIGLIGVILLEQELQIPSFNTKEKLYSNLRQLIGRGNRKGEQTQILIQTFIPENDIISTLTEKNYKDFFTESLTERKIFSYPPLCEMISITYRHTDKSKALSFIQKIEEKLKSAGFDKLQTQLNNNAIKKHNQFHYSLIIKGNSLREKLEVIKKDIFKNPGLVVTFHR